MTSLIHQFCYQATKSQSTQLGSAKTQQRSIPFATQLFTPHFADISQTSPPRLLKNHDFTFSPILLPRHKKQAKRPNLVKPKPYQDQFLLQPNFSHLILHTFVTIAHQESSKTVTSLIHQFCYQGNKSQSTQLG